MATPELEAQREMDEREKRYRRFVAAKREVLTDPNELVEFLQDLDGGDHFTIHLAAMFKAWLDDLDYCDNADFVCQVAERHPIIKALAEQIADQSE